MSNMIANPHGIPEDTKILDDFMKRLDLDWMWTNYPATNLYHYKGSFTPKNSKPIRFELFINYLPEEDSYRFSYICTATQDTRFLLNTAFPKFEEYFLCCTVSD